MESSVMDLQVERLVKFSGEGTLRAFCDLAVGNFLLIKGLRVVEGKQGLFVSMPRHQGKDGRWYDVVRWLTKETKIEAGRIVLEAFQQEVDREENI